MDSEGEEHPKFYEFIEVLTDLEEVVAAYEKAVEATSKFRAYTNGKLERRPNKQLKRIVRYERLAFRYDSTINYAADVSVDFGTMNISCQYCDALRFQHEPPGLCCLNGKVKLPKLLPPPKPLESLLSGQGTQSKHFFKNIQRLLKIETSVVISPYKRSGNSFYVHAGGAADES
ncbi:hypothetical protein EVAR_20310_1 [Eumeta japonica]|uniref:Uncharacterized protein n=1 Tax=Eumeta variegata TaxID=151549 RepID=A0A4C1VP77_EUMVA|nr:hypothetical protein EVAR_20310_1 [Eumeta japonica]